MADTLDELRAEVAKWREQGNDGTGIVVNLALAETLLARPDLDRLAWALAHSSLKQHWAGADPNATTASQQRILEAFRSAAERRIR